MKTIICAGCLTLAIQLLAAQGSASEQSQSETGPLPEYSIVERGPHHRVWQRTETHTGPDGKQYSIVHSYTELATGMHYLKDEQWVESKAEIEILPNGAGAAASQGQHKVIFPPDIYDGQIELNTPDGKCLRSRVLGLSYFDTVSGDSVLIGQTTNSVGTDYQLTPFSLTNWPTMH